MKMRSTVYLFFTYISIFCVSVIANEHPIINYSPICWVLPKVDLETYQNSFFSNFEKPISAPKHLFLSLAEKADQYNALFRINDYSYPTNGHYYSPITISGTKQICQKAFTLISKYFLVKNKYLAELEYCSENELLQTGYFIKTLKPIDPTILSIINNYLAIAISRALTKEKITPYITKIFKYRHAINSILYKKNGKIIAGAHDGALLVCKVNKAKISSKQIMGDGSIFALSYNEKDRTIFIGYNDGSLDIRNKDFLLQKQLYPHIAPIYALANNETHIASASGDNTIAISNIQTGAIITRLHGHTQRVYTVHMHPKIDGLLASGSHDKTIRLWNFYTGKELLCLQKHTDSVTSVAFNPIQESIVSGSYDCTALLWDCLTGDIIKSLGNFNAPVLCCAWNTSGQLLAIGTIEGKIYIGSVYQNSFTCLTTASPVYCLAWAPNSIYLAAGTNNGTIITWSLYSKEKRVQFRSKKIDDIC